MFPTYFLHMEREEGRKVFLLAGRKRKKSTSCSYIMSTDPTNMSRSGAAFRGLLKSNMLGTHFKILGRGGERGETNKVVKRRKKTRRGEIAAVIYEKNVLGFNGPRFMTCECSSLWDLFIVFVLVIMPQLEKDGKRTELHPVAEDDGLIERYSTGNLAGLMVLRNKQPYWSNENQSYVLNFHGRVTRVRNMFKKQVQQRF